MWCHNKNCSTLSLIQQILQMNALLPKAKSGCELSPPAGNLGPRQVKISSWQQEQLKDLLRGFVNQLRMCWFVKFILVGFFCSLFVCLYCCLIACLRILLCKQALLLEDVIFRKDPLKMLILLSPGPPLSWKKIVSFGSHSTSYCDFGFGSKYSLEMSLIGQKDKELRNLSIGGECEKAQNCKKHNLHWFSLSPNELIIIQRALHIWSLWVCVISTLIRRMDCSFLLSQVIISGTGSCFHSCPKDPRKLDH